MGEQRLVGADDVLPGGQRLEHEAAGDARAAHQLDHDVDRRVVEDTARVADQNPARQLHAAIATRVDVGDAHQIERHAEPIADRGALALQQLHDSGADRAEADQSDADGLLSHAVSPR
jgi:hypothetical protein